MIARAVHRSSHSTHRLLAGVVASAFTIAPLAAQTPGQPAPTTQPTPTPAAERQRAEDDRLRNDWANLERYRRENAALPPARPGEARVVFMGNSITDAWARYFPTQFPGKPYIGRGIGGQTTPQMLVRFRPDVVALKPAVVVILAGTNDIAGNTGPSTLAMIEDNLASMAEVAKANGIRVVLSSVLPVYDYPWRPGLEPATTTRPWPTTARGSSASSRATGCTRTRRATASWRRSRSGRSPRRSGSVERGGAPAHFRGSPMIQSHVLASRACARGTSSSSRNRRAASARAAVSTRARYAARVP